MRSIVYLLIPHFYATIAENDDPARAETPFVVTAGNQVIDVSRTARAAGVSLPTTLRQARLICPQILELPCYDDYFIWTKPLLDHCAALTPLVEPVDEATSGVYLDFTGCGPLNPLLNELEKAINEQNFVAMWGIAENKLLANLAARVCFEHYYPERNRLHIGSDSAEDFIGNLPLEYLSLTPSAKANLMQMGIYSIGELLALPDQLLFTHLGGDGKRLRSAIKGLPEPVQAMYPPETVSYRANMDFFGGEIVNLPSLHNALETAAINIARQFETKGTACQEIKLMLGSGKENVTQRASLKKAVAGRQNVLQELKRLAPAQLSGPITSVTITASKIVPAPANQLAMFTGLETERQDKISTVIDNLKRRFGSESIKKSASLSLTRRERFLRLFFENGL